MKGSGPTEPAGIKNHSGSFCSCRTPTAASVARRIRSSDGWWKLTNTASTVPITLHGSHNGLSAVRYPDGTVCVDSKVFAKGEEKAALAYVEKRRDDHERALERASSRGVE